MKTKESLFNDIVRYTRLVWQTGNIQRLNPLIRLMMEEICNELHLLYGKLDDTDVAVLEKLIKNLSPSVFNYVRPGHAVLHIKTGTGLLEFRLDRTAGFYVKTPPVEFKEDNMNSLLFTPVVDTDVRNISIARLFYKNVLWATDVTGNRTLLSRSDKKAAYNTVWLGLEIDPALRTLRDLPFYIDFPDLRGDHPYFDLMAEIRWMLQGQLLKMKPGFPVPSDTTLSNAEKDLLNFYRDHYQTLPGICLDNLPKQRLPEGLAEIVPPEITASLTPLYWLSITFPPHFAEKDLEQARILLNAFPVVNRYYREYHLSMQEDLTKVVSLSSGTGEAFMEIDGIICRRGEELYPVKRYAVDPVKKDTAGVSGLSDRLEKVIDVLGDEKTAFPSGIDSEKLMEIFNSVSSIQNNEMFIVENNRLRASAEVARLAIRPEEETTGISIYYWNTHAELLNGLPAGTALMAHKVPELNKTEAVFITPVSGGCSFLDPESRANILQFYLTAKDRILTKNDVVNFCRIELGDQVQDIQVVRNVRISQKFKEGMIHVIEIRILPRTGRLAFLQSNGVLKSLRLRLQQRSPDSFRYKIAIMDEQEKKWLLA
ncbi:MAG: hypothetical protein LBB85_04275 [Dysgonamonadaceae bacterium]|jgi:hypothetical protein|nr:hypothetical protein [Dysgonamonadaceae bacterium]